LKGDKATTLWEKPIEPVKIPPAVDRAGWIQKNPLQLDLLAGGRLYGRQAKTIFAVDLPAEKDAEARVSWSADLEDTPGSMLAADGKLFIAAHEGAVYCFGEREVQPKSYAAPADPPEARDAPPAGIGGGVLDAAGVQDGYCVVLGLGSGKLVEELAGRSKMYVIAIDPDEKKVETLRRKLDAAGLYGSRVSVHAGDPLNFALPPYLAVLVAGEDLAAAGLGQGVKFVEEVFHALRPYGGAACFAVPAARRRLSPVGWRRPIRLTRSWRTPATLSCCGARGRWPARVVGCTNMATPPTR